MPALFSSSDAIANQVCDEMFGADGSAESVPGVAIVRYDTQEPAFGRVKIFVVPRNDPERRYMFGELLPAGIYDLMAWQADRSFKKAVSLGIPADVPAGSEYVLTRGDTGWTIVHSLPGPGWFADWLPTQTYLSWKEPGLICGDPRKGTRGGAGDFSRAPRFALEGYAFGRARYGRASKSAPSARPDPYDASTWESTTWQGLPARVRYEDSPEGRVAILALQGPTGWPTGRPDPEFGIAYLYGGRPAVSRWQDQVYLVAPPA